MCAWVCDWRSNNYWSEQKSNAIIPSNLSLKSVLTGRPRIRNRQKSKKSHKLTRESIIGFYHPYCLTTAIHTTPRETNLRKIKASLETANPDIPKNKLLEWERKVKLFVSARWSDAKSSKNRNRTPASVLPQVLTSARSETKTKRKNCLPKNKRVCTVGRGQQLV